MSLSNKTLKSFQLPDLDNVYNVPEIADEYTSKKYDVGDYVNYQGVIYRCTTQISAAEAWNASHWTSVKIANDLRDNKNELTDLKSALDTYTSWYVENPDIINGYFIDIEGNIIANDEYAYTDFIATNSYDKFIIIAESEAIARKWIQLCFYDFVSRDFISRIELNNNQSKRVVVKWENSTVTGKYLLRLTFQTTYNTSVKIIKVPNEELFKHNTLDSINTLNKTNPEQLLIPITNNDSYIDTYHAIGYVVDLNVKPLSSLGCEVIECSEGDNFTITGQSTQSTALWAFVDADNKILSRSSNNTYAHQLVITAPRATAKLIINVFIKAYYCIYRGNGDNYIDYGTRLTTKGYNQHYINTNVDAFETVDLTPLYFSTYCCAIVDCTAGETFTISGRGGVAGRLWAFLSGNNTMLTKSAPNENAVAETIIAPNDAKKLVINSIVGFMTCYKGHDGKISNSIKLNSIPTPIMQELPKNAISQPSVTFSQYVQEQTGVSGAKPTIYKNGDYFCITYGENINGSGTDIPMFSDNGVLVMRYKFFKLVNGIESDVSYGTFAQMGTEYTDYSGNTAVMTGGSGLPSGTNGMQYFTTPYLKEDGDKSYTFAGISKYGMTPCCCTVTVNENGVSFGTINELKLYANGEWGKFDLHRVDADFYNELTYLTTSAPYHDSNGYKWLQPVTNGIAYLTSTNGVEWIYRFTIKTAYQPRFEVVCTYKNNMLYYAARSNTRVQFVTDTLYVGKISTDGYLALEYRLPFVETRPCLVKTGDDILLFYTPANKQIAECIRICEYGGELFFWKWFTIYKNSSWYVTCFKESVESKTFDKMYIAGGNGEQGSTTGMTFMELSFDTSKPYTPVDIPAMVI